MIKSANDPDCFMKPSSRVAAGASTVGPIGRWSLNCRMRAASAAVPVGRAHHRALQSGGDAAALIIQSRQIEKFKIAAKLACHDVYGRPSRTRLGWAAAHWNTGAQPITVSRYSSCQSLALFILVTGLMPGLHSSPLSSDHTVLWPLRFRRHSGSGRTHTTFEF